MSEFDISSVGLVGDGDEIFAIEDVEREFGVILDKNDAAGWYTAGDVFQSLTRSLDKDAAEEGDVWNRFVTALADETGVEPNSITPESPLIEQGHSWRKVHDFSVSAWLLGAFFLVAVVASTLVF